MEGDDVQSEFTAEETQEEETNNENEAAEPLCEELCPEADAIEEEEGNELENTDESASLFSDPDKNDTPTKLSCSKLFNIATDRKHFDGDSTDIHKMESASSHAYHFKRKYNFRSDSVFSDVTPMPSSSEATKTSEARDKSGSLTSLKCRESRWVSLRRKLGKVSTNSEKKKTTEPKADKPKPPHTLEEKRSLLQRAKTLSILPVNRTPKEETPPKPKELPPELFNVGGEMNMIPLELLIDISSIN